MLIVSSPTLRLRTPLSPAICPRAPNETFAEDSTRTPSHRTRAAAPRVLWHTYRLFVFIVSATCRPAVGLADVPAGTIAVTSKTVTAKPWELGTITQAMKTQAAH